MVQVLDNIVVNAIQAYEGKGAPFSRWSARAIRSLITVCDFGKGIDEK